ncbi:MAG TPA: SDR family oxidoreductase [Nocardioidaceae bacterium]|nr:SDR family oxidoreductase [Nocardioidaceae bacterium]
MTRAALVTGGSRGIGAAIAHALAAEGFNVTVSARNAEGGAETVAEQLRCQYGVEAHAIGADMAVEDDVRRLSSEHEARFGRLDLLILNAGVATSGHLLDVPMRRFDLQFNVNLRGPVALIQESLPLLRLTAAAEPARGARIVAIASITGVVSEPSLALYGASKAALISLCETLTLDEHDRGVSATAISPGYVDTDMAAWKADTLPRDRMMSTSDVAEMVLAMSRLSVNAVVPNIVMTRPGAQIWRA